MIEDGIYDKLTNTAAVTALVSTRIFPNAAPASAVLPFVTYQRITTDHIEDLGGGHQLARALIQFSAWATGYRAARAITEAIRVAIQGYAGTNATVVIDGVNIIDDRDLYEPPGDGQDIGKFGSQLDAAWWFVET